jgi:hypothetical protein
MNWLFTAVFEFSPHVEYPTDETRYEVVEHAVSLQGSITSALAAFLNDSRTQLAEENDDGTFRLISHSVTRNAGSEYGPVFEKLLKRVPEEHKKNFERFVLRGEASDEFLRSLDTDPRLVPLVEEAFQVQARAMERLQQALNR